MFSEFGQVEQDGARLEVAIGVLHLHDVVHIVLLLRLEAVVQAGGVGVLHCGQQVAVHIHVEQLGDVFVNHHVAVQVQGLVVAWQDVLHKQAEVRLYAEVAAQEQLAFVFAHQPGGVEETQAEVGRCHEALQHGLAVRAYVAVQHHDVVRAVGGSMLLDGFQQGAHVGNVVFVGGKHQGNRRLAIARFDGLQELRLGNVFEEGALKLLGTVLSLVLQPGEVNAQKPLCQVPANAVFRRAVLGKVAPFFVLFKDAEQPFAVVEEDFLLHDEHIAEIAMPAIQVFVGGIHHVRVFFLEYLQRAGKVFRAMLGRFVVLFPDGGFVYELALLGQDEVVLLYHFPHTLFGQADFLQGFLVVRFEGNISEVVRWELLFCEGKIATVMEQAVIVGVQVLPGPVLRSKLAVAGVFLRDIVAFVVVEHPLEACGGQRGAYLYGANEVVFRQGDVVPVAGHNDFDVAQRFSFARAPRIWLGPVREPPRARGAVGQSAFL